MDAWDQPPPFWSETSLPSLARRQLVLTSPGLISSQVTLMTDRKPLQGSPLQLTTGSIRMPAPDSTHRESSIPIPNASFLFNSTDLLSNHEAQYLSHILAQFMLVFILLFAAALSFAYLVKFFRRKPPDPGFLSSMLSRSKKQELAENLAYAQPVVIRSIAVSENLQPDGSRNRKGTSS